MGMEESDYSFFIKMFPSSHIYSNERGKYLVKRTKAFQREIETNFCFLRQLNMFVKETMSPTDKIKSPDIVYGSHDEGGNGVIVWMDATAAHGFQPTNHCKGNIQFAIKSINRCTPYMACFSFTFPSDCRFVDYPIILCRRDTFPISCSICSLHVEKWG